MNIKDKKGNTPLYALIDRISQDKYLRHTKKDIFAERLYKSYFAEQLSLIAFLIKHGANVNIKSKTGDTLLHKVSIAKVADILIKHGAKLNIKNNRGNTPLHEVIGEHFGNLEIASLLVEKGANVTIKNKKGDTPLHKLAQTMYVENNYFHYVTNSSFPKHFYRSHVVRQLSLASLLIKKGANVNAKNKKNQTPLDLANLNKDKEIVSLLIKLKHKAKGQHYKINP